MYCSICNKSYSNQSSYNRHLYNYNHRHNLENPYHTLIEYTKRYYDIVLPKDLINIIWDYTYPSTISIFEQLEHGNIWKVKDLIWKKKIDSIKYIYNDNPSLKPREIKVIYKNRDYKEITIRAGEYHLHLDCMESEYIWKKISHMKDKAFKLFHFISEKDIGYLT